MLNSICRHFAARLCLGGAAIALALFFAGGLGVSEGAAAQGTDTGASVEYHGDLPFHSTKTTLLVTCGSNDAAAMCPDNAGTFTVEVSNAAKHRLGISSKIVGKGDLVICNGGFLCGEHFAVPANVRRKLLAKFNKAASKCSCSNPIVAPGKIIVSFTAAGLPHETISHALKIAIGSESGVNRQGTVFLCTSNWAPPCGGPSGGS